MKNIFMSKPSIGLKEKIYVESLIDSGEDLSQGPWVERFEARLGKLLKVPAENVVAVSSGTAALHLAFLILKLKSVTMPAMTFISTGNMALMAGTKVEFVDIDPYTWNAPADVTVDLFGNPAGFECLIEDAAEALGSSYCGAQCGTFGRIGVLSFFANKIITSGGEGGALVCREREDVRQAFLLRQQGKDYSMPHPSMLGYNYRMTELSAAFGCAQLTHLKTEVRRKRAIFNTYHKRLKDLAEFQTECDYSNRWLTVIKLPSEKVKKKITEKFNQKKVPWRDPFYPLNNYPWFKKEVSLIYEPMPETEDLYSRGICLPSSFGGLYEPKINFICDLVENALRGVR